MKPERVELTINTLEECLKHIKNGNSDVAARKIEALIRTLK